MLFSFSFEMMIDCFLFVFRMNPIVSYPLLTLYIVIGCRSLLALGSQDESAQNNDPNDLLVRGFLQLASTMPQHNLTMAMNPQQLQLLREFVDYGMNASDYLFDILEPQLYEQGARFSISIIFSLLRKTFHYQCTFLHQLSF